MKSVLVIDDVVLGGGDDTLGAKLMASFVSELCSSDKRPSRVVFLNSGVKLACEGSPMLDDLLRLAGRAVELLSCGTCLDHFELREQLRVGRASNMREIADSLLAADRVIHV